MKLRKRTFAVATELYEDFSPTLGKFFDFLRAASEAGVTHAAAFAKSLKMSSADLRLITSYLISDIV